MNQIASIKQARIMAVSAARSQADTLLSEGDTAAARLVLVEAIKRVGEDLRERVALLNSLCKVERAEGRLTEALRLHMEAYPLVELSEEPLLKARFHNGLGITYQELSREAPEYLDRALIAYEAARFHAQEAGDEEESGRGVNNLAVVLCQLGRHDEARGYLAEARARFTDPLRLAEIADTEARVLLACGQAREALRLSAQAVQVFLEYGERRLLDAALPVLQKAAADYRCEG